MNRRTAIGVIGGAVAAAAVARKSFAQVGFLSRISFRVLSSGEDETVASVMCQNPLLCHDVEWGNEDDDRASRWESEVLQHVGSSVVMTLDGLTLGYCDVPFEDYFVRDSVLGELTGYEEIRAFRVEAAGIRTELLPEASIEYEQLAWALLLNRVFQDAGSRGRSHSWVSAPFIGAKNVLRGNWEQIHGMTIVPDRWRFPARTEDGVTRPNGTDEKGQTWFVQVFEVQAAVTHTQQEVESLSVALGLV